MITAYVMKELIAKFAEDPLYKPNKDLYYIFVKN